MARQKIGTVKSGKGRNCEVQWDQSAKSVYVATSYDMFTGSNYAYAGKASSAREAMNVAEAYVYNK